MLQHLIEQADTIVSCFLSRHIPDPERTSIGVLLSGGIDSSVITQLTIKRCPDAQLLTMGTPATKDRPYAEMMATFLGRKLNWLEMTDESIAQAVPDVKELLAGAGIEPSLMQVSLGVGYYLICAYAHSLGIRTVVTGQGPDVLFAGYSKYKRVAHLEEAVRADIPALEIDVRRDAAMAKRWGVQLVNPYLSPEFIAFSHAVPVEYKREGDREKIFMREWGVQLGLPQEIVRRPKKAFQYSTGVQAVVRAYMDRV